MGKTIVFFFIIDNWKRENNFNNIFRENGRIIQRFNFNILLFWKISLRIVRHGINVIVK